MTDEEKNQVDLPLGASDPWAQAFAALAEDDGDSDQGSGQERIDAASGAAGSDEEAEAEDSANDGGMDAGHGEGSGDGDGEAGSFDLGGGGFDQDLAAEDFEDTEAYVEGVKESVRAQAIRDVADFMKRQGIMTDNKGRLGATIYHPSIYKKDEDGMVQWINPDTGRPFGGDNPRAQANQWVKDYNDELRDKFNELAQEREAQLAKAQAPIQRTLEFAPTYSKLDPVRRQLLDSIIEDYEVRDGSGDVVGYSCDLNKALAQVNRQVQAIQAVYKSKQAEKQKPKGPALDMKAGATDGGGTPNFKNVAEALAYVQEQELQKARKK